MNRLTEEQVLAIHTQLIAETGGEDGVRDSGLLDSALMLPFQTFEGQELYSSIHQKAAQLCHSLITNHPFVDGNKRAGVHLTLVFLVINGVELQYTQPELVSLGLDTAQGKFGAQEILDWILEHEA